MVELELELLTEGGGGLGCVLWSRGGGVRTKVARGFDVADD